MNDLTNATWSRERIAALGPTTDVLTAASVLGIGSWTVYDLIRRDAWGQHPRTASGPQDQNSNTGP
ncbi:hypothetical protein [Actinomadura napierensis]|uniref:DNA-binding protein n=1 Tax=Actinomadura napierensis TaxID=267854 RepID=A0ABP5K914_9ACTN